MSTVDPIALIESLDPDQIREEMDELDRRQRALSTLLRVALARNRKQSKAESKQREKVES